MYSAIAPSTMQTVNEAFEKKDNILVKYLDQEGVVIGLHEFVDCKLKSIDLKELIYGNQKPTEIMTTFSTKG
ncbi:MAG: hypothetical protein GWN01_04190, partial [Nitrosopumilaceae archaeon]|nr:hypothetical protein [Nitrosopumilaceae archaeon]NIU86557.1 hypothetical protein [Nitrosopumilaceae archaeon]NIV65256.1 hypothetical protein [Nitrosopumilaceae archaeon]NIX60754.1 hypothetical protein [Nitrosopumilaceae archaeon]